MTQGCNDLEGWGGGREGGSGVKGYVFIYY